MKKSYLCVLKMLGEAKWLKLSPTNTRKTNRAIRRNKISSPSKLVVVQAIKEKGIEISTNKPKMLTQEMANQADLIVTMGCGGSDFCTDPFFKENVDWTLEDPKGKSIDNVREIRDEIEGKVQ